MARDITVTFDDDSQHVYQGAPDNVTPTDIESRAQKDFGKKVKALDGGRSAAEPPPAAPQRVGEIPTGIRPNGSPMYAGDAAAQQASQGAAPPPEQPSGMMGMLNTAGRAVGAAVETPLAVGTGATTGFLGGLLNMGNRVAQQITGIVQGKNADEIKASGPSAEGAFAQGMQAGTYQPRTAAAQEQVGNIGEALQTHGPALIGVGPEIGAMGKILAGGARPAATMAGEAAGATAKAATKKVLGVNPEKLKVARLAEGFGIDVRPDQIMDNKAASLVGEGATHVPLSGAKTKSNQAAFNKSTNQLLNPEETSDRVTQQTWSKAMDRAGSTVGEVMGGVEVPFEGGGLAKALDSYEKGLGTETADTTRIGSNYVDQLRAKAEENNGVIPGETLRKIDSELGQKIRSTSDGDLKRSLGDLQEHIRDAAESQIKDPADVARLKDARRQYAWGKLIEPAVAKSINGNLSPALLMNLVTATKTGKGFMARNAGGRIGDLAKVGQLLKEPATSNTAERAAVYSVLGGAGYVEPHTAAGIVGGANAYNRLGPKLVRALGREEPPPVAGEVPPAEPTPPAGGPGPGPETPPAPTDPRLAEIAKLREGATDPAVQAALDAHEKTVQADLKTKAAAAKQAASVDALEAAAKATHDPDLRATLQKQADKLRAEKIPVGEATELAGTPTPKPEKVGKIPVGKVVEGQPALPVEKTGPIPTGAATEITPEVIAPEEPIPVGEATDVSPVSNRPAAEVVSNQPQAEPVSNRPTVETGAPIVNNEPVSEYSHGALFKAAEHAGIETRGRRPAEVRAAFEKSWAKEHGLNPMDAERAKNVAQALNVDEAAVEAAAKQHEKSPRAFDRAIDDIIQGGTENAFETHEAANSGEGPAPNPPGGGSGKGGAGTGRGGNANVNPERPGAGGSNKGNSNASGAAGPVEATAEQPGPNSPAATGTHSEVNQPGGSASESIPVGEVTEGAPETHAANNASGESEASSEAINRAAREKAAGQERVLIDRDGTVRPLIGPSAVDQVARPGQVVAQKGVGAKEWTVLSSGADMTKGGIARALSKLSEPRGFEKGARKRA